MKTFLMILAIVSLGGCSWRAKRDFNRLCADATEIAGQSTIAAELRDVTLARRVADYSLTTEGFRNTWAAIGGVEPKHKYMLVKQGALETGYPDWECPVLQQWWAPQN